MANGLRCGRAGLQPQVCQQLLGFKGAANVQGTPGLRCSSCRLQMRACANGRNGSAHSCQPSPVELANHAGTVAVAVCCQDKFISMTGQPPARRPALRPTARCIHPPAMCVLGHQARCDEGGKGGASHCQWHRTQSNDPRSSDCQQAQGHHVTDTTACVTLARAALALTALFAARLDGRPTGHSTGRQLTSSS